MVVVAMSMALFLVCGALVATAASGQLATSPADVIVRRSFDTTLSQIAYDSQDNALVVAAAHGLFRISGDLQHVEVTCGLGNGSAACTLDGSGFQSAAAGDGLAELLLVLSNDDVVLVCGMYQGQCEARDRKSLHPTSSPSLSKPLIVSNGTDAKTVGTLVSGVLFVGTSFPPSVKQLQLYAMAARGPHNRFELVEREPMQPCDPVRSKCYPSGVSYLSSPPPTVEFVAVVAGGSRVYFVKNENSVARIVAVCTNETRWQRYVELPLTCGSATSAKAAVVGKASAALRTAMLPTSSFLSQLSLEGAEPDTLFVLMSGQGSGNKVAVCAYALSTIDAALTASYKRCYSSLIPRDANVSLLRGPVYHEPLESCVGGQMNVSFEDMCNAPPGTNDRQPLQQTKPLQQANLAMVVLDVNEADALAVDTINNITVAYVVTKAGGGSLHKIIFDGSLTGRPYETVALNANDLRPIIHLSADKDVIYLVSKQQVLRVNVSTCSSLSNCSQCVLSSDPHCGWCALQHRCTTLTECQYASRPNNWLTVGSSSQCFGMKTDQSMVSVDSLVANPLQDSLQVRLFRVPESTFQNYDCCLFDDAECSPGRLVGVAPTERNGGRSVVLQCAFPSKAAVSRRLGIQENISTAVSARVDQLTFDSVPLTFYNCSVHEMCTPCMQSSFSCEWLLSRGSCVSKNPPGASDLLPTSKAARRGDCPRFQLVSGGLQGLYAHAGIQKTFTGIEIVRKQPFQTAFKCIFVGGAGSEDIAVSAVYTRDLDRDLLKCSTPVLGLLDSDTSSFASSRVVPLRISWDDGSTLTDGATAKYLDNIRGLNVTVYRCKDMAGHCGLCLNLPSVYNCGWCELLGECTDRQQCSDSSTFLLKPHAVCSNPLIVNFYPKSGPTEGNTRITITGHNLGLDYDDVKDSVSIVSSNSTDTGSVLCPTIEELYEPSMRIVCVTPETEPFSGFIRLDVGSRKGVASSVVQSADKFVFARPSVMSSLPLVGPISGGTRLTVTGVNLNVGSNVTVTLGPPSRGRVCSNLVSSSLAGLSVIRCTTPARSKYDVDQSLVVHVLIDKYSGQVGDFTYDDDPVIETVTPQEVTTSGGTRITVTGQRLNITQEALLYFEPATTGQGQGVRQRRQDAAISPTSSAHVTASVEPASLMRVYSKCVVYNGTYMVCQSPTSGSLLPLAASLGSGSSPLALSYGFIMDNVSSVTAMSGQLLKDTAFNFLVYPDPEFHRFKDGEFALPVNSNQTVSITGQNILRLPKNVMEQELTVHLGDALDCPIAYITEMELGCRLPALDSPKDLALVVRFGVNKNFSVGMVRYQDQEFLPLNVIIGIACGGALIIILVIVVVSVLVAKARRSDKDAQNMRAQMDNLEMRVAKECKEAFAELQTDMHTEMNSDDSGSFGLPFFDYRTYCMKVLFPNANEYEHPVVRTLEIYDQQESVETGIRTFGNLIGEKTFLLLFIRTLESNNRFTMRDRVSVASLVSVALQGKMSYHTEILKTLLSELIEKSVGGTGSSGAGKSHPRLLLRRTESVAEKMLTNWFTFLLHKFLRECAGEPLFMLYRAVKQQIDKGPVDVLTGEAKYSLSEDRLLRQQIDYCPLSLRLLSPEAQPYTDPQIVKVLDCDSVSQALDKILDVVYRNLPHSSGSRPSRDKLDLEWIQPSGQRVILRDDDAPVSSAASGGRLEAGDWRRVTTLAQCGISDMAMVALVPKQPNVATHSLRHGAQLDSGSGTHSHNSSMHGLNHSASHTSMSRVNSQSNMLLDPASKRVYHLVKPHDSGDAQATSDRDKMVSEIYLTRLLATKGTLQSFVDDLFETIFSTTHRGSALPLAIKYMFDFLDDQALFHGISEPEVIHTWKSNSLPLRFWVNVIKNPDFVFDIHKSSIVDACLSVVAQIFMESCSLSEVKLGKDSPSSKLLYAKDIPKYRKWVERYYQDIKLMPAIHESDMNVILAEESKQHSNEFNTSAALVELYKYVQDYSAEIAEALDDDEFARQYRLRQKLEQVNQLMGVSRTDL